MGADRLAAFRAVRARLTPATSYLFFEVVTRAGRTGVGEATMSGDDARTASTAEQLFEEHLAGRDAAEIAAGLRASAEQIGERPSLSAASALSGLEQCLLDLRGQLLGCPVYELLGGRLRERVRLYANINRGIRGDRSPGAFAERGRQAVRAGFSAVKVAPFDGVRPSTDPEAPEIGRALDRVAAVRSAVGEAVGLMVDCHGRLSPLTSERVLPSLRELGVTWFEEPLITHREMQRIFDRDSPGDGIEYPPVSSAQLLRLARTSPLPLAGAEFEYGLPRFQEIVSAGALSYLMPDVKYCGGVALAHAVGELAGAHGIALAPHNPSGPVATVASMHVCLASSSFAVLEFQWAEVRERGAMIGPPEPFADGWLTPYDAPGLGVRIDHGALEKYAQQVEVLCGAR